MMVAVMVLGLCGNAFAADETVTISYCNFNASGGNEETLDKMVAAFEAEHPRHEKNKRMEVNRNRGR